MYLTKKNNVFNKPEPEKDDKGNIKRNCTTMFLLPSVLNSKVYTSEYGFINAYLQDHTHEVLYKDCLHVLFSPKKFTKDFEDYINALEKMYNLSIEERREMGKKGRNHVLTNYNFQKFGESWVNLMEKIHETHGSWNNRKNYNKFTIKILRYLR
jgi:hypothetical protein